MAASTVRSPASSIDRAVLLVLLTRAVPLLAAPVTLWLIATRRPLLEQGPYFVFWNTQALVQLMELGVGALIVQFASHESPLVAWDPRGGLVGDVVAQARVRRLVREGQQWYSVIAVGLLALAGIGGSFLLRSRASALQPSPLVPWLLTVVFTAAYLPLVPMLCTIEGCGGLLRVQRMRLTQVIVATAALWSVMLTNSALWAVAAFAIVWWPVACFWLIVFHRGFISQVRSTQRAPADATTEPSDVALLSVQWRTGVSWMAWWVATQALTPIVLASHGPSVAGQVGMTLAIAMAPLTLA